MCFKGLAALAAMIAIAVSCGQYRKYERIRSGDVSMMMSVADDVPEEVPDVEVVTDSIRGGLADEPFIMRAIKDSETGEMVATDVISASRVVARFRNVAERFGYVTISFDITVPAAMSSSRWQLKIHPKMLIQQDTVHMDPVYITGSGYREMQLRGYERYQAFLNSILTDPEDFLRIGQLEIFLERHFPETYAMKNDTSFISDPRAENLFGVTQKDALEHYKRQLRWKRNERRKARKDDMYRKYVKDPLPDKGVRLDTVLLSPDGDFIYRYSHVFQSRPKLKKVDVMLSAGIFEEGECILELPMDERLTFYVSSLSSLAENVLKYKMMIRKRTVYDHMRAFIEFEHASSKVDTMLGENAYELQRVRKCIEDMASHDDYLLDSLVIVASCSPEGTYELNSRLSSERSTEIIRYLTPYVPKSWRDSLKTSALPENWDQLVRMVENDTLIGRDARRMISSLVMKMEGCPDALEERLSQLPEYPYLRQKIYPMLRNVRFDFHLHRADMVEDTLITAELDTVYMAGLEAIRNLDYRKAVTLLRPYDDYNSALAFMCADYNHSAWDVLQRLDDHEARVCYLKAVVLARMQMLQEAVKYYDLAVTYDPTMKYRANLDPEMFEIVKLKQEDDE